MAVNKDELAICKRRGHKTDALGLKDWTECRWCGIWLREVTEIEEREDEPPEGEKNIMVVKRK